jgi:hypothetical protein
MDYLAPGFLKTKIALLIHAACREAVLCFAELKLVLTLSNGTAPIRRNSSSFHRTIKTASSDCVLCFGAETFLIALGSNSHDAT